MKRPNPKRLQAIVDSWNANYAIGSPVDYRKDNGGTLSPKRGLASARSAMPGQQARFGVFGAIAAGFPGSSAHQGARPPGNHASGGLLGGHWCVLGGGAVG